MAAPWERREAESQQAWEAFATYRDMGAERSTAKVGQALSKSKALMDRWSSTHGWVERVVAWDAEQDRVKRDAQLDEVEAMGRRHAQQGQALLQALMAPAISLLKRLSSDEHAAAWKAQLDKMEPIEALALISKAASHWPNVMKAERLARGESTERIDGKLTIETVTQIVVEVGNEAVKYIPDDKLELFRAGVKRIVDTHTAASLN